MLAYERRETHWQKTGAGPDVSDHAARSYSHSPEDFTGLLPALALRLIFDRLSRRISCSAGIPRCWRDTRGFSSLTRQTAAGTRIPRVSLRYIRPSYAGVARYPPPARV